MKYFFATSLQIIWMEGQDQNSMIRKTSLHSYGAVVYQSVWTYVFESWRKQIRFFQQKSWRSRWKMIVFPRHSATSSPIDVSHNLSCPYSMRWCKPQFFIHKFNIYFPWTANLTLCGLLLLFLLLLLLLLVVRWYVCARFVMRWQLREHH